jgi:hypothetical protein
VPSSLNGDQQAACGIGLHTTHPLSQTAIGNGQCGKAWEFPARCACVHVSMRPTTYGCARPNSKQQHAHGHTAGLGACAQGGCSVVGGVYHGRCGCCAWAHNWSLGPSLPHTSAKVHYYEGGVTGGQLRPAPFSPSGQMVFTNHAAYVSCRLPMSGSSAGCDPGSQGGGSLPNLTPDPMNVGIRSWHPARWIQHRKQR